MSASRHIVAKTSASASFSGAAVAGGVKLLRLQANGAALTTAGSSYTYKAARIDMAIEFTEIPNLDEAEGEDTYTLAFRAIDHSACDHPVFTIVNELAALV
jgi:hypothetical protein